jgi:ribosomal protein L21E
LAELWYNTSHHDSLGCSPFKALYGYEADTGTALPLPDQEASEAAQFCKDRDTHLALLKEQLTRAQQKMKDHADLTRTGRQFQVGDQVLLKLQPYVQNSVVNRPFPKLAFKYFGPYRILEKIGRAAYKLDLPAGSLVHPVFHVSQLKTFHPDHTPVYSDISTLVDLSTVELQPEAILDRQLVKKGNNAVPQVLIKWTKLPIALATWEDWYVIKERFKSAAAWGQAAAEEGGDVVPQVESATATVETENKDYAIHV